MKIAGSIRLGTFFRTRIRIHYTWLLVFILVPWSVSTQFSTETVLTTRILLGLLSAVLFFFGIFLREIMLLLLANYKNIEVESVTIFAFGGLIQTDSESTSPSLEMLLAVTGMLSNFVITAVFYFSSLFVDGSESFLMDVPLQWLAFFFLTLGLFHIIPAYPLEGGRMIHVLLWKLTNNLRLATRVSGISGWILGFLTMAGGILLAIFTSELFTGLFFVGLGLIIQNAATHGLRNIKYISVPSPTGTKEPVEEPPFPDMDSLFDYSAEEETTGEWPPDDENWYFNEEKAVDSGNQS
ncbi:MAG: hypothetical protein JW712_05975 [Dehalococcoidales bacterium]|nr:hypothetical protein [Dehalococcoidales bacterium]